MSGAYFDAMRGGLSGVLSLFKQLALPAGIFLGLLIAAAIVAYALKGSALDLDWPSVRKSAAKIFGYSCVGLLVVCLWSGLRQVQPSAKENIEWKDSAEASDNPAPEAPPIDQYGPVAAVMVEKTYQRTLTLPPEIAQHIGAEGIGMLSPYLVDPTAENVLKLVDSFKRVGQDVVFTREVTREDEAPISFDTSDIKVAIHRLREQAYDADFTATYSFSNPSSTPVKSRFLFTPPQGGGTLQDIKISVGGQDVAEPDERGAYAWTGQMGPGESRKATVHYRSTGGRSWNYDLGSNRRRVKAFNLEATVDGQVQFKKGSIQPTSRSGRSMAWKLTDVVTSQQLALSFPQDVQSRESYLQALATLPAVLVLFGLAILVVGARIGVPVGSSQLAFGILVFALGLGSTAVLNNYLGPVLSVLVGPLAGAVLSARIFGWRFLLASLPVAMIPATSLSAQHTGLWILVLAAAALIGFVRVSRETVGTRHPMASAGGRE